MSQKIQAVRGMNDLLPMDAGVWQALEHTLKQLAGHYGYQEIRTPTVEKTALFCRSIGEVTDIVQKEMYTFEDRNGESLSLRPEGTASVVRAAIEHGMLHNQRQRLWYLAPMFRHERPQKGRYRQFYQFGIEAFGFADIDIECEQLLLLHKLWQSLGLAKLIKLEINTIGTTEDRERYHQALTDFFVKHESALNEEARERARTNPLRLLDSKDESVKLIIADAPLLKDHLSNDSRERFEKVCSLLNSVGIDFEISPRLVRGLDYYSHTVFEWTTDALGAQGTVCAGGRYDRLVSDCGGKDTPSFGFAMGIERLVLLLTDNPTDAFAVKPAVDVMLVLDNQLPLEHSLPVVETLRNALVGYNIQTNLSGGSFKSQFKQADKSGASYAIVLGEEEIKTNTFTLAHLREKQDRLTLSLEELVQQLQKR